MKDSVRDDIEFLSNAGPQDAGEMIGVCADECGTVGRHFIGNPSSAGHLSGVRLFRPFRGFGIRLTASPTPCAVGFILSPLGGFSTRYF
jgi:hypothetical protein